MEIKTVPVAAGGKTAQGLMVSWDGGQFVMIVAEKGLLLGDSLGGKHASKRPSWH